MLKCKSGYFLPIPNVVVQYQNLLTLNTVIFLGTELRYKWVLNKTEEH